MQRVVVLIWIKIICCNLSAQVVLPRLVRDSMILQRDIPMKIWGMASPNEKITLRFNNKYFKIKADATGNWMTTLPAMRAGGPYTMDIAGKNKIILRDILIGDVWFCSGQSNMVHQLNIHDVTYAKDIAEANYPQIRHFWIQALTNLKGPQKDLPTGFWKPAVGDEVRPFSAVAYFFAKKIYDKYKIPIGLINASVGGSPIDSWTSEEGLNDFSSIMSTLQKNKDTGYVNAINRQALTANANRPTLQTDRGLTEEKKWFDPTYIPKDWRNINIPGYWEDQGIRELNGVVWYRKEIVMPVSITGKPARIFLGRIVDADELYVNGVRVGNTTYMYPQRRYHIAPDVLRAGKNILVVRVTNTSGKGGFVPDKPYCLLAGNDTIDLKGSWQYKVGDVFFPRPPSLSGFAAQNQPAALYNAMVAPVTNYAVRGFLWYQGESNTGRAEEYTRLQPALVADWRKRWGLGELPFLYVQLPNFMDANYLPSESQWAEFRFAQLTSLSITNSAMAVAIDLGEWNDLHPDNKKDVGERLALAALRLSYGENIVFSGPIYRSSEIIGNKIVVSFDHIGSGLVINKGEELSEFAIAGQDKKYAWAKARIEGDKVIVWNDSISNPQYVRYAWADNPVNPNLYNKEGLPASPFQTNK